MLACAQTPRPVSARPVAAVVPHAGATRSERPCRVVARVGVARATAAVRPLHLDISSMERAVVRSLAALGVQAAAVATTEAVQRAALVELYQATGGSSWTISTGWGSGDPCDAAWSGVSCNGGAGVFNRSM